MQELKLVSNKNLLKIAAKELSQKIVSGVIINQRQLEYGKIEIAKRFGLDKIPKNAELIPLMKDEKIIRFLRTKPVRTLSGVANIAVMWKGPKMPNGKFFSCPYQCIYCPQGENSPKSYTGVEPTTLRAKMFDYNPYEQVKNRLMQFHLLGHPTDKCELIIMGGTFMVMPYSFRENFVLGCFNAFNETISGKLEEAHKINETVKNRCVGLTIETRADWCRQKHISEMLELGCTRVEIGVQTTDEELLRTTKRGHDAKANMEAFRLLRENGLKITAHWMPGLTGLLGEIDMSKEIEMFRQLFSDTNYRPDELKIYPTLVIEGTGLYELWKAGKYKPLTNEQASQLLIEMQKIVPRYVRIKRIMRDISEKEVDSGPATTNLRQLTDERMKESGIRCQCIRCREVGLNKKQPESIELIRFDYEAGGGKEIFLSFEDIKNNLILGFLRLRIDSSDIAKVRELHVYGSMVPINKNSDSIQHRGLGKKLVEEAENIAKSYGKSKMQITSGVGARRYYIDKLGYKRDGYYVSKEI